MAIQGEILTLFKDTEKTQGVFPRTKVSAVSNEDGVGLDALLADINTSLGSKAAETHTHTPASIGALSEDSPSIGIVTGGAISSGSWDDLMVSGQTVIHQVSYGLTNEPTTTTTGWWLAITTGFSSNASGVQIAIRQYTTVPKLYMRKYIGSSNTWGAWAHLPSAEYDSASNTLNFIM